jgi:papain like cysteine protease AvrRpt2/N-acetylmuramoyl-L-alanine amidase-like protein
MTSSIRPNRAEVSRSFPVLGFTVKTSAVPAWFEVALATNPALFGVQAAASRSATNFWTSRPDGLIAAQQGEAIFLVPNGVLARFAGAGRLYYALAVFPSPAGGHPELSVPGSGAAAPFVALSGSYTGVSRRLRTGPSAPPPFSPTPASFAWAGDIAQPGADEKVLVGAGVGMNGAGQVNVVNGAGGPAASAPAAPPASSAHSLGYDDGFGPMEFLDRAYTLADPGAEDPAEASGEDPERFGIDGPPPDDQRGDTTGEEKVAAAGNQATSVMEELVSTGLENPDYQGASRFVAAHPTNFRPGRLAGTVIDRIVIHITDARTMSSTVSWFAQEHKPGQESSAHYIVGRDGEIVQMVHEADTAYHARGANSRGIGIEHVATAGFAPTDDEYCASATLVRDIATRYNIALDRTHIVGHNDMNHDHPDCPTAAWDWDRYMRMVTTGMCESEPGDFPLPPGDTQVASAGTGWALGDGPQNWGTTYPTGPVPVGSCGDTWALLVGPANTGTELHVDGTIDWRYNNPGSIRPGRMPYPRAVNVGRRGFAVFPTYAEGRRALADLLRGRRYGPQTLAKMFWTYLGEKPGVPSDQGDPEAYARDVITWTGLAADRTVDSLDDTELELVMNAIERQEGYNAPGERPARTYRPGDSGVPAQFAPMLSGSAVPADARTPASTAPPVDGGPYVDGGTPADGGPYVDGGTPADGGTRADAGSAQALEAQSLDLTWPDVELVPQPTSMSCWAAAAAMVVGWRDRVSINPAEIARGIGPWVRYEALRTGLFAEDTDELATAWKLSPLPPQSYSVDGFRQVLESHGPLWVGVAVPSGHAICVYGMYGDGTPEGTKVRILDPWPPGRGERAELSFADFENEYESRITTDAADNVNIQIIAAADTGGRRPATASLAQALAGPGVAGPGIAAPAAMRISSATGTTAGVSWSLDRGDGVLCPWGDSTECGAADGFQTRSLTVHGPEVRLGSPGSGPGDFTVSWRTNGRAVADIQISPVPGGAANGAAPLHVRAQIQPRPEAVVPAPGDIPCAAASVRFMFDDDGGATRGETALSLFGTGDVRSEAEWRRS